MPHAQPLVLNPARPNRRVFRHLRCPPMRTLLEAIAAEQDLEVLYEECETMLPAEHCACGYYRLYEQEEWQA